MIQNRVRLSLTQLYYRSELETYFTRVVNEVNKRRILMTAEEIVLGGYELFSHGDLEGLSKIYHPGCRIKVNGTHALSGEYRGFESCASNF